MHSLRTKFTFLTICMILAAVSIVTLVSILFIRHNEHRDSDQFLLLLCETGERNLDYYFNSVQKSVEIVSSFAEEDLRKNPVGEEDGTLESHVDRVGDYFTNIAYKTNGVLTYYYRIDPEFSDTVEGFWFTNMDGEGFVEHEVTDIKAYDTRDISRLVWFTVAKNYGNSVWLPPYITENLDARVISYNVPIFHRGAFVGVVGIEIDYTTMAEQVESIRLYRSGYAFLNDAEGNLFYHPFIDVAALSEEDMPKTPEGLVSDSTIFEYTYEGVRKQAAWLPLSNGMRLTVSAPLSETEGEWKTLLREILIVSVEVLILMSIITLFFTKRITKPLQALTAAAEQVEKGNYDFNLEYDEKDEVGMLTRTFLKLTDHLRNHIGDLNKRVYIDPLTSVKNKGAFSAIIEELQTQADQEDKPVFGVGVFDCNDLKLVNDRYGHDKGDIYLKTACRLICRVYQHSPVYRIGGDEFAVILRDSDFQNRQELALQFEKDAAALNASAKNIWEQVHIAMGFSVYDPEADQYIIDTVRRADKKMYANKRRAKKSRSV